MVKFYKLYCDDDRAILYGDEGIDIDVKVQEALESLSDNQIVSPEEDWFWVVVERVCSIAGLAVAYEDGECDVERLYWAEHNVRTD